jgi:hypothetical protein
VITLRRTVASLALLALTGCGSTVQVASTRTTNDGLGTTGTTPNGVTPGGTVTNPGQPTVPGSEHPALPGTVTGGTTTAGGSAVPGSKPVRPGVVAAVSGRGFTRTTVKLGYATADDSDTFVAGLGLEGLDDGDPKAQVRAVVDDINRRGGLAGRRIELVPHDYNSAQLNADPKTANQAACATWTQDEPVFAVILPAIVTDNLLECLHKAHTPLVSAGFEFPRRYAAVYQRYPGYFHIGAMVGERYDAISIDRLVKRGYFEKWDTFNGRAGGSAPVRIGVIVRNDEEGATQEKSVVRELAKHGLKPYSVDHCTSTINASSCTQNVELRYQTAGVTHVMGNSDIPFMSAAEAQHYRPRYFMVTALDLFAQNAPQAQLNGAMSENYMPSEDVPEAKDPGPPSSATTYCLNLMRRNGQTPSSRLAAFSMESACDAGFFVKAAIDSYGSLSGVALQIGLESLGTRVKSAATWAARLGPDQHAAVYGLRDLLFNNSCRCFEYTSTVTYTG